MTGSKAKEQYPCLMFILILIMPIVSPCKKKLHFMSTLLLYAYTSVIIVTFSLDLNVLYLCPLLCHFMYTGSAMHAIDTYGLTQIMRQNSKVYVLCSGHYTARCAPLEYRAFSPLVYTVVILCLTHHR